MSLTTVSHDYYDILGITQSADLKAIKSAYRKLALVKHPDRKHGPNATAEFQLLNEAYEHLSDPKKRQEYDRIYRSIIMPEKLKNQKISELNKRLRQLDDQHKETSKSSYNTNKDLIRLFVELDSLRGQKELIQKEKAKEETWWQYVCSLTSGKAAEFTRARQLRDHSIVDLIGKQRTKELNVDRKLAEVQALEEKLRSISFVKNRIRAEAKKIEDEWREMKSLQ